MIRQLQVAIHYFVDYCRQRVVWEVCESTQAELDTKGVYRWLTIPAKS